MDNSGIAANDSRLIAEARTSSAAFARLYRRHYDAVFRYCVHRLFERQTAEDITSEVFLKVVEKFHRFKGGENQFRNWLYTIATNEVNNHLRKSARRKALLKAAYVYDSKGVNCEGSVDTSAQKLALLKKAMWTLKPKYQTIITLRFSEKMKLVEIAELLGARPATVRSQLARALAKLRKKLTTD